MTRQNFYPNYEKAKSHYINDFPPNSKKHWPYDEPVQERAVNELLKKVVDPSTQEYYKGQAGEEPKRTVSAIVRIKTVDGKEYVYSKGSVKFYNMYHDPITEVCDMPEVHEQAIFVHETLRDERENHDRRFTTGIEEKVMIYDLEFNDTNIDKLYSQRSPRGCDLTVKDELSGRVKKCKDLEMFKTQSIDYILNDEWQTPEQREAVLREHELEQGRKKR